MSPAAVHADCLFGPRRVRRPVHHGSRLRPDGEDRLLGELDRHGRPRLLLLVRGVEGGVPQGPGRQHPEGAGVPCLEDSRQGGGRQGIHRGGRQQAGERGDRRASARTARSCSTIQSSTPTSIWSIEQIKGVRGMEGYGWFANVIFHDKDDAEEAIRHRFLVQAGRRSTDADGYPRAEGPEAGRRRLLHGDAHAGRLVVAAGAGASRRHGSRAPGT